MKYNTKLKLKMASDKYIYFSMLKYLQNKWHKTIFIPLRLYTLPASQRSLPSGASWTGHPKKPVEEEKLSTVCWKTSKWHVLWVKLKQHHCCNCSVSWCEENFLLVNSGWNRMRRSSWRSQTLTFSRSLISCAILFYCVKMCFCPRQLTLSSCADM